MGERDDRVTSKGRITRRALFRVGGIASAAALAACDRIPFISRPQPPIASASPFPDPVPTPPAQIPVGALRFFKDDEGRAMRALLGRMLPGDAGDPGAREAGVLNFVDNQMASSRDGWAEPIYTQGPFAKPYEGQKPPDEAGVVWVEKKELPRYGFQSKLSPREIYRKGLAELDMLCARMFLGKSYAELGESEQDALLGRLAESAADDPKPFDEFGSDPPASTFFQMLQKDTINGLFADPMYGGNVNNAGWKLVSYPGIHRSYTPQDIKDAQLYTKLPLRTYAQLPDFNPGHAENGGPLTPVEGAPTAVPHR